MNKDHDISYLLERVEACFGITVTSSRHFDELRESIYNRTGILLSATTLKRLWGYLKETAQPRLHTLDVLSRYAGWRNWQELCQSHRAADIESGPVEVRHIYVRQELQAGDTVILTWAPSRLCRIRSLGDDRFEVLESTGSRLQPGDCFRTGQIIDNAPLFLNHLTRNETDLGTYVCGSKTGIRFVVENQRFRQKDKKGLA